MPGFVNLCFSFYISPHGELALYADDSKILPLSLSYRSSHIGQFHLVSSMTSHLIGQKLIFAKLVHLVTHLLYSTLCNLRTLDADGCISLLLSFQLFFPLALCSYLQCSSITSLSFLCLSFQERPMFIKSPYNKHEFYPTLTCLITEYSTLSILLATVSMIHSF